MYLPSRRPLRRLLITGGAGFIGSAFIRHLFSTHSFDQIVNLDTLTYAADLSLLESISKDPRYVFVKGDICNTSLVKDLCKDQSIDTIVHFAAESHVDRSIDSALPFLQTNILGTASLLEAVRSFPQIHFHHISTDEVYGSLGKKGAFSESSAYCPNSPYATSKAASDHLVRSFAHTYGLSTTISHCTNNYGPGQYPEKLIPMMISRALAKEPLPLYGSGEHIRDWLYVNDHAQGVLRILQWGKKGETYDMGGQYEMSNRDLIHRLLIILSQETGTPLFELQQLISYVKDRLGHDFRYAIDTTKIKETLGWQPTTSFEQGLTLTIRWYLNRYSREIPGLASSDPLLSVPIR